MEDFEKLGSFYLGKEYDLEKKQLLDRLVLYDSKDLVTHAVCVGMTGSGKTGLCVGLLEEAAIDGIPSIIIDPKGDLTNLLLSFPELSPSDFAPWINEEDARKKGLSTDDYAVQQADLWRRGLADWGQSPERISRLRSSAEFRIYTPGSSAGIPVSILKSFAAPPLSLREDVEILRNRINTTVTSLLGLLGIEADPVKSREHILLSTIFSHAWSAGNDLDLAAIIQQVQSPPVEKVGVLDIESFYPAKDRFELSLALNNLLAAPGFSKWMEGEALDLDSMLHSPRGTPRVCIFSIAHLGDSERMFFVSLLLNQVLGWMRMQSGTTSLRAIMYMDEIFGYFPPVANPPSKLPLLTLLKQARAFGLGVVLATQNPVDLDYKGLANTGTWFIGRLQTERDKARVLDGLEGASTAAGQQFERSRMEAALSSLGNRVFVMNNVHEDAPVIFQTRWTLSYLRGPLTRDQIKMLAHPAKGAEEASSQYRPEQAQAPAPASVSARSEIKTENVASTRPVMPPEIHQVFVPQRAAASQTTTYQPYVLGIAQIAFSDTKTGIDTVEERMVICPLVNQPVPVDWDSGRLLDLDSSDLENQPHEQAAFKELPAAAGKPKSYDAWSKELANWFYRSSSLELMKSAATKLTSAHGESERDFRLRVQQALREERDDAVEKLRQKYAPKIATLEERLRRTHQTAEVQAEQARGAKYQTAISFGATILSSFLGRKTFGGSTMGRAATAARGVARSMKESSDVTRATETVEAAEQRLQELQTEFQTETDELKARFETESDQLETVTIKPKKKDLTLRLVALAWVPESEVRG